MKRIKQTVLCAVLFGPMATAAFGQEWYFGATGGYGLEPTFSVKQPAGSASAGFDNGYAAGAFFGEEASNGWGGEVRYLYRQSNLKLESGGTSVHFAANTNILNFDLLRHFGSRESSVQPFVAFGAGMKFLDGTGAQSASQPLGAFAALTNTRESIPAGDVGFGVKTNFRRFWQFRAEVRDYIGPAPQKVIAPTPPATLSGLQNDIIVSASIAYCW